MKKIALLSVLTAAVFMTVPSLAKNIQDYISDIPGIGLICDEIDFDGVKLRNLSFINDENVDKDAVIKDKYVITKPSQKYRVEVEYQLDSNKIKSLGAHHLIYGLDKTGPQNCFLHSIGQLDRHGRTDFVVQAPDEPGIYQLRFCKAAGLGTFASIKDAWYEEDKATSKTIMGIIVVKDE